MIKVWTIIAPLAITLIMALACNAQPGLISPRPAHGQRVFVSKGCIKCHSVFGFGGKIGSDLGRSLSHKNTLDMVAAMWNHSTEMSQAMVRGQTIPQLDPDEMASLLSFFYYLNFFGEPGEASRGAMIFKEKGCASCHNPQHPGPGPDLQEKPSGLSTLALAQQMWNHAGNMVLLMNSYGIRPVPFKANEMADLSAYLRGQSKMTSLPGGLSSTGNVNRGRRLIQSIGCLNCHSINGKGKKKGSNLAHLRLNRSAADIAGAMWNHAAKILTSANGRTAPFPSLQGNDLADILAFLFFLDFRAEPGNAERGEHIFMNKNCDKCHSMQLQSRRIGPNLATARNLDDMILISSAMWNHDLKMQQAMRKQNIPFPRFNGQELKDLLTFIQSIRNQELEED